MVTELLMAVRTKRLCVWVGVWVWGGEGEGGGRDGGRQNGDASRRGTEDTVQSMPCLLSQPPVDGV